MSKRISMTLLLSIVCFGYSLISVAAQTEDDLRKREKEFKKVSKTLTAQGIIPGSIGEKLNDLFREYVSRGGCGLVDSSRVEREVSFVPDAIPDQDSTTGVKTRIAEVIKGKGVRMFWYVYKSSDKNNINLAPGPTRFLSVFDSESNRVKVEPSRDFSNWILSRNCSGYLNTKADAKATFFTLSASTAISADFKNTASIVLIGGTFTSPLTSKLIAGGWQQLLLDLGTWNLYSTEKDLVDDAWILKSFDGIMADKEVGISRNFSFDGSTGGNVSIPIGNIAGSLKTGMLDGTTMNFKQYQLLIASDITDLGRREQRFVKLSTADQIAATVKSINLTAVDADKPLIRGLPYRFSQLFRGMPKNICESRWSPTDTRKNVFDSLSVTTVPRDIDSDDKLEKIPVCEFQIEGMPNIGLFTTPPTKEPDFEATLRNENNSLKVKGNVLELTIKQKFNTSSQPVPSYVGGSNSIPFVPQNQEGGQKFSISWRDIDIKFDDSKESVKKDRGTPGDVAPAVVANCGDFSTFQISGEMGAVEGSVYRMTLRSGLSLLSSDYDPNSSSDEPCNYQTTITVPLARSGNPPVTRNLSLVLRVPKKKVKPAVITPAPTVPVTTSPTTP